MKDVLKKRRKEKELLSYMIDYYCKKNHKTKTTCEVCNELKEYSILRIDKCPFMETKNFCSSCMVHCYKQDKKEQIRKIMRYSGPRMIFHHPIKAISHVISCKKEKRKNND